MSTQTIDWSQLWYPGPKRAYTADEMARAGGEGPGRTLKAIAAVNFATLAFTVLVMSPPGQTARLCAALVALAMMGNSAARWLWWRPWRRPLLQVSLGLALAFIGIVLGARWRMPDRSERLAFAMTLGVGTALLCVLMWFLVVWRSAEIDARLREQAERDKAIEMARRLAAAQIEPHFLFNTLASVQHWVQTHDERAAPLLASLTGYLRATLPLFRHALLAAGEELVAVTRYLEVMQARLGAARLQWALAIDAAARRALLPPGLLLTLVENAVAHGIEPQLAGGRLTVRGTCHGGEVVFQVIDNGPGAPAGAAEGVGLANVRQRLALACGAAGSLTLQPAEGGGCCAAIRLPFNADPHPDPHADMDPDPPTDPPTDQPTEKRS